MTRDERIRPWDLLARSGQKVSLKPEPAQRPDSPLDRVVEQIDGTLGGLTGRMDDLEPRLDKLEPCLDNLQRRLDELERRLKQIGQGEAALRQAVQALQQARNEAAGSDARERARQGRRARSYGFLAGIGIALMLLPVLSTAAGLGWGLFRLLARLLAVSPEMLAGCLILILLGLLLLRMAKCLGQLFLEWLSDEEDPEEDESCSI